MKMLVSNRNQLVFILVVILIGFGTQSSYGQTIAASVSQPLTEANLHGSIVTITLSGGTYEQWIFGDVVTVSGIDGVDFDSWTVERLDDTQMTVELIFDGDFDTDGTLTFTVEADAIADYDGDALTATLPVTALEESLVASTEFPLTEANLHGSIVTLTLSGRVYDEYFFSIEDALTISGIDGVTVDEYIGAERVSDTEASRCADI